MKQRRKKMNKDDLITDDLFGVDKCFECDGTGETEQGEWCEECDGSGVII